MGSRSGVLYRLGKIYKESKKGLTPFRPTPSAIESPTCKLAEFLLSFLKPSTVSKYSAIDSFHFVEEIYQQDPN